MARFLESWTLTPYLQHQCGTLGLRVPFLEPSAAMANLTSFIAVIFSSLTCKIGTPQGFKLNSDLSSCN